MPSSSFAIAVRASCDCSAVDIEIAGAAKITHAERGKRADEAALRCCNRIKNGGGHGAAALSKLLRPADVRTSGCTDICAGGEKSGRSVVCELMPRKSFMRIAPRAS